MDEETKECGEEWVRGPVLLRGKGGLGSQQ